MTLHDEHASLRLVDVFGRETLRGNPLPVILGAASLGTARMQSIARWFNTSETAFLLPPSDPDADYRVRIFTLERELPFAGHPTLGSCHAWLGAGGQPRRADAIVQECGVGTVRLRRRAERLEFEAPPLRRSGPLDQDALGTIVEFLGVELHEVVDAAWADNGPGWAVVLLDSAARVLALRPPASRATRLEVGVVGPHPAGSDTAFEVRAFFTDHHGVVREDPVTGSLNASIGQWLFATRRASHQYVATQGVKVGHAGFIHLCQDDAGAVWVGGAVRDVCAGPVYL